MKHLFTLSPAEIALVLEGRNASANDLLKLTYIDLLLKKILKSEIVIKKLKRDPDRTYMYILAGENLKAYSSLPHENVFLEPYRKNKKRRILFSNLIDIALENGESKKHYIRILRRDSRVKNCFHVSFFEMLTGKFSRSASGELWKTEIETEMNHLENELSRIIGEDKSKVVDLLKKLNGNIFLLKKYRSVFFKEIEDAFSEKMRRKTTEDDYYFWDYYYDYPGSFSYGSDSDAGVDFGGGEFGGGGAGADWGDGDSSGDGGDSGCSGCGGCGGCGGD